MKLSEEMGNVRADQFIQDWISAIDREHQDDFAISVYDLVREILEEENKDFKQIIVNQNDIISRQSAEIVQLRIENEEDL